MKLSDTYEVSLGQDTSDSWTNEVFYLMIRGSQLTSVGETLLVCSVQLLIFIMCVNWVNEGDTSQFALLQGLFSLFPALALFSGLLI